MSKIFNVTGVCLPNTHYMVDIKDKLKEIKVLIDNGEYFTINRARQYGKTTTLNALNNYLQSDYIVISMDFQYMGAASFAQETTFSSTFADYFVEKMRASLSSSSEELKEILNELAKEAKSGKGDITLYQLFKFIRRIFELVDKPIVLMIDEVDSASNNQVFLDFLATLRVNYLNRENTPTFQSVVLVGVYNIKNLRTKIRPADEHKNNSPWNIAADFDVDMSLSLTGIKGMLADYENDYHTGMNIEEMAALIHDYTSGYPFLVSRLCKYIDEKVANSEDYSDKKAAWTNSGFQVAYRMILTDDSTLFQSLTGKLDSNPELNEMIYELLFLGKEREFNTDNNVIALASMFGFIKKYQGNVAIANRIFETRLYNRFLSTNEMQKSEIYNAALSDKSQFIENGHLNMRLILEKFVVHFDDLYGDNDETFYEDDGRRFFLLYLRPIIKGTGNYYVESRTRNRRQTDVIVDYRGKQYIIELKHWHGKEYNKRGEEQLLDYLNFYHLDLGYMLSFNFNKKKMIGVQEIVLGDKVLVEAVV